MKKLWYAFESIKFSLLHFWKNHTVLFTWTEPERSYEPDDKLTPWEIAHRLEYGATCFDCQTGKLMTPPGNGQQGHKKCTHCKGEFIFAEDMRSGIRLTISLHKKPIPKKHKAASF